MGPSKPKPFRSANADASVSVAERVATLDWSAIGTELDERGVSTTGPLLSPDECTTLAALFDRDDKFRSRIVMARHGFGRGEYKYFAYPLPGLVAALRAELYPRIAPTANRWFERMGQASRVPPTLEAFLKLCHAAGQVHPTPLLLRYKEGDYNCLHRDLYGATVFPIQVAFLLSRPLIDFEGGEFVLVEQRPRMQSRAEVVSLGQGEGVIFAVSQRPVRGTRGDFRVSLRHGVSRIKAGNRYTLGIIFHDAM
jgi:uncharacterized protein